MDIIPDVIFPRGSKRELVRLLMDYVKRKGCDVYRRLLSHFRKTDIDAFLPRNGTCKAESTSLFIELDRTTLSQTTIPDQAI